MWYALGYMTRQLFWITMCGYVLHSAVVGWYWLRLRVLYVLLDCNDMYVWTCSHTSRPESHVWYAQIWKSMSFLSLEVGVACLGVMMSQAISHQAISHQAISHQAISYQAISYQVIWAVTVFGVCCYLCNGFFRLEFLFFGKKCRSKQLWINHSLRLYSKILAV